jgi:hypothetical protein
MWRAALSALLFSGLCVGCENSEFYNADTRTWFGPYAGQTTTPAPTPVAGNTSSGHPSPGG